MAVTAQGVKDRIKSAANPAIQTRGPHFPVPGAVLPGHGDTIRCCSRRSRLQPSPDGGSISTVCLLSVFSSDDSMLRPSENRGLKCRGNHTGLDTTRDMRRGREHLLRLFQEFPWSPQGTCANNWLRNGSFCAFPGRK